MISKIIKVEVMVIGSCRVGVFKCFHVALESIVLIIVVLIHFLADQISRRSYVGSVYRMRSLAVSHPVSYSSFVMFKFCILLPVQ